MVRQGEDESVSERIINMIVAKKKARVDLAEDLKNVATSLFEIQAKVQKELGAERRFENSISLLN